MNFDSHLRQQIEDFTDLLNQNFLVNKVDKTTRGENLLDLKCTNNPDCCIKVTIDKNIKFSDHNRISMESNLTSEKVE